MVGCEPFGWGSGKGLKECPDVNEETKQIDTRMNFLNVWQYEPPLELSDELSNDSRGSIVL